MRVSERLELVSRIGRELQSRYTFDQLYSYLAAFSVPRLIDGPTNSKWSYTKAALESQPVEIIVEIAKDLDIEPPGTVAFEEVDKPAKPPQIWQKTTQFKLFISHIARDKDKATRLKEALAEYAISGFVAHEDIHPTLTWQDEIERGLYSMDAMIAVHTKGFSQSYWTQQEIGFALGRNVKVISLKMGEDPTGFISKHQALARRGRTAAEIAPVVNNLLHSDERTRERLEISQSKALSRVETIEMEPELAALVQHQHRIDYEAAGPKAAVDGFIYRGVQIESRWAVKSELNALRRIVEALPENIVRRIMMIWCDANAQAVFTVYVRKGEYIPQLSEEVAAAVSAETSGHNGISIEEFDSEPGTPSLDTIDPSWGDSPQ